MNISKAQFLDALKKNGGIASRTAKYITDTYKIKYTRMQVYNRKMALPKEIRDQIDEEAIEDGESALRDCLESKDDAVKLRAAQFLLTTKGREKGYGEKQELIPPNEPIIIRVINASQDQ